MIRTCPSDEVLADMLADRLPPDRETEIEQHLTVCGRCRVRLDRLTCWDDGQEVSVAPEDTALPHRLIATVAARLARAVNVNREDGRRRPRSLPAVPGYELLAEIGRGGCGVVYRAVDRNLARTVALKLLQDRAGPEAHERFRREATALAQLRHPNVVQIYDFGDEDGQPFLALEFVGGGSLCRFTGGQPQDPSAAAEFLEALARGVGAANQAGFVHRDLKPANILLERHRDSPEPKSLTDFSPKVTDFGVVKSLAADPGLTDTRDFLGTPSYMAPEQAGAGRPVDNRADVYALGAILYELLTGRPPFRAATPIDTLVQVAFDDPVPPSRLQPKLPRDLETVCLTCLEKDPARRYATAEALADDLARFRDGRPVTARPVQWPTRAWRWCRRRPARAAVAALAASVVLFLAVGGPIVARREFALRRQADESKEQARQHLELASRALDETLGGLVGNARLRAYGMDEVRADTLRGAVPYLEEFAHREEGSPDIKVRQARAMIQLATVHAKAGMPDQAAGEFRRGIESFERLSTGPAGGRYAADLADAHFEYGRFLLSTGAGPAEQAAAAERELRTALLFADGIASDDGGTTAQRDRKAIILATLAGVPAHDKTELAERRDLLVRALRLRERLVAENPDRQDLRRYAATTACNLGLKLDQIGEKQAAADVLLRALADERRLIATNSLDGPRLRSNIEGTLGAVLFDLGRQAEGFEHVGEARRTAEAAAMLFPGEDDYLAQALLWQHTLAQMFDKTNEPGRAIETRRESVEFALRVIETAPSVETHHDGLLAARLTYAEQLAGVGRPEAAAEFAAAAAVGHGLTTVPTESERRGNRAECFRRLAAHDLKEDRPADALGWLDRAVALIEHDPTWSDGPFRRAIDAARAESLKRLGRVAEAAAARLRAATSRPAGCPAAESPTPDRN